MFWEMPRKDHDKKQHILQRCRSTLHQRYDTHRELRNEFIFLFGVGVSPEQKMMENCIIVRSA
jgi:hypothetical protein